MNLTLDPDFMIRFSTIQPNGTLQRICLDKWDPDSHFGRSLLSAEENIAVDQLWAALPAERPVELPS